MQTLNIFQSETKMLTGHLLLTIIILQAQLNSDCMWSPRQRTAVSDRLMLRRNLQRQGHRCCNTASTVSHHLDRQPLCQRAQRPAHHLLHHNHKVKLQTTIHCIATFCQ